MVRLSGNNKLFGYQLPQFLRFNSMRIQHGAEKFLQHTSNNIITRYFDFHYAPVIVYMLHRESIDLFHQYHLPGRQIVDERFCHGAFQEQFLLFHEYIAYPENKQVDQHCPEILHFLIVVIDVVKGFLHPVAGVVPFFIVEERKEKVPDGLYGNNVQSMSILKVNDAVADIVGRFFHIDEGMRSEEHTSELQSHSDLVCRLLLEKKSEISARQASWLGRVAFCFQ